MTLATASFAGIIAGGWIADRWSERSPRGRVNVQIAGALLASPPSSSSGSPVRFPAWLRRRFSLGAPAGRFNRAVGGALVAGPALFVLGYARSLPVLIAALILFGIGRGFYDCNT